MDTDAIKKILDNSPVIERLESKRVFSFREVAYGDKNILHDGNGNIFVIELCDEYFFEPLSSDDLKELSDVFSQLAQAVKDSPA